ncbi:MAG: peroxiredoxin [Chthoniobacterales bacterium]
MPQSLSLPDNLPVPQDDGACGHLAGLKMPQVALLTTAGSTIDFSSLTGRSVIFCYPKTGLPGKEPSAVWNEIPGARGCTPQNCGFRDEYANVQRAGVKQVFGLSTQSSSYQREAAERLHLPYLLVSDEKLAFTHTLNLPTFDFDGETLIKRLTLIVDDAVITHVLYPVFPPDKSAADTLAWIKQHPVAG